MIKGKLVVTPIKTQKRIFNTVITIAPITPNTSTPAINVTHPELLLEDLFFAITYLTDRTAL